ncbi:hypothetical protein GJ700_20755 [Duganella sp. FT92W]|uniref:Uncharacterized protein n=1 Tax=Pseudoduganella rivuli TaxID=2666085 RepID=A0A7X2IQK3_9BURK|nr:hypothetical protein [Pseudoduganella rivuli]MRV74143.1 hypothetical protein [Pseudoduganella rivuli]
MAKTADNRHISGENMPVQNFCAWIENAYESMGLLCNKAIAHNLINRMWGELHSRPMLASALFLSIGIKLFEINGLFGNPGACSHFFPQKMCRTTLQDAA